MENETRREVTIEGRARARMRAELVTPASPRAVVVVATASGDGATRARALASTTRRRAPVATIALDVIVACDHASDDGALEDHLVPLFAERVDGAADVAFADEGTRHLPAALVGFGRAGAAALLAATIRPEVRAVVSVDGRPDLAGEALDALRVPSLLVVDEHDDGLLLRNRGARARLRGRSDLVVVPGAPVSQRDREREAWADDATTVARVWAWLEGVLPG